MTITIPGTSDYYELEIKYIDWRGQTLTKSSLLAGSTTATQIEDILTQIDTLTNCQMLFAKVTSVVFASGMKSAPNSNVPNDDINDVFELSFVVTDTTTTPNKVVSKSVFIPAPLRAMENTDGTLNTSGSEATPIDTLLTDLAAHLVFKEATGAYAGGMTFSNTESHHISLADIVDNQ